jgi:hypothetical protein
MPSDRVFMLNDSISIYFTEIFMFAGRDFKLTRNRMAVLGLSAVGLVDFIDREDLRGDFTQLTKVSEDPAAMA